jgi:hypothetical protein
MKKYLWIFICIYVISFGTASADGPTTTGIIAGQIWYSEDPLVAGDTVKVYTAVWNGDTNPLQARVEFFDQNVILGDRDIVVDPQSLKDVSVSWQVTPGNHVIHATITSSSVTTGTKTQAVTLNRTTTADDNTYVPVVVTTPSGTPVKTVDVIGDEVKSATTQIQDVIPPTVTQNFSSLDAIRAKTATELIASKADVQNQINTLNTATSEETTMPAKGKTVTATAPSNADPLDATQKPIAYIKLFFLTVLAFIFQYPIVFYVLLVYLIFIILRFAYRKIKNR